MGRSQKYPVPVNMDGGLLLPSHSGSLTLARTHVIGMDVSPYISGHDHEHVLESEKMSPLGSQDMTTIISDAKSTGHCTKVGYRAASKSSNIYTIMSNFFR
jgi:hypothetical protein